MNPLRPRVARRPVHGVLLLDKPLGLSSHEALQRAKRLYRAEKAGHTGTLDPLATGLLPICFGAATKFSQASLEADKAYRAELCLGITTTTGDGEGEVTAQREIDLSRAQVEAACAGFVGTIAQVPPMHSALKHEGRKLYAYAREGVAVERAPRTVTLRRLEIVEWAGRRLVVDLACSKGTYVRTLAEDLGNALGCGAYLSGLRRTASGGFDVSQAASLESLAEMDEAERDARLLPPDALLAHASEIRLDADEAGRFLTGLRRRIEGARDAALVRVYGPERAAFLGSGRLAAGELIADRLLSPTEVEALIQIERRP